MEEKGKEGKASTPSPIDLTGGFYASLLKLSKIAMALQDTLRDVLGLKECKEVWRKRTEMDIHYRANLKKQVSEFMKTHSKEEVADFLEKGLFEYYSRRIDLSRALSKISDIGVSSNCLKINVHDKDGEEKSILFDCDVMKEIRACLSRMSDVHSTLVNILCGSVPEDSVDDKKLCDEKYLESLAGDFSEEGYFMNAHDRFEEILEELESSRRQVEKLEKRAESYAKTEEAEADRRKLKELERDFSDFMDSSEVSGLISEIERKKELMRRHLAPGSATHSKASAEIAELKKRIDEFQETPEAKRMKDAIKEQRARVLSHRNNPEAKAAALLAGKRREAMAVLESRLALEAERFCRMRDEILRTVARAFRDLLHKCRGLPDPVRDVFRRNPPGYADDILMINSQMSSVDVIRPNKPARKIH